MLADSTTFSFNLSVDRECAGARQTMKLLAMHFGRMDREGKSPHRQTLAFCFTQSSHHSSHGLAISKEKFAGVSQA
jgi:hypothetical protein